MMWRHASSLLLLVLLLWGNTGVLWAQPTQQATLQGMVIDAETGDPLPAVHVFIATSTIGTTTDREGRFRIENIPIGAHRLVLSMVGYTSIVRDILLRAPTVYTLDFGLIPEVIAVGDITVTATRNRRWQKRLEKFSRLFLGETPNAAQTVILNPEVLDFESKIGRFTAMAKEPLLIENKALGYRIRYFLNEFVAEGDQTWHDGEPLFEPLAAENTEQAAMWEYNRSKAFHGSFRHFMIAAMAGQASQEGFRSYSRKKLSTDSYAGRPSRNMLEETHRVPLEPQSLFSDGATPNEQTLDFKYFIEIVYTHEEETEGYLEWQNQSMIRRPGHQTSWIRLTRGAVIVDGKGDILNPYGITFFGYLSFERTAELLPKEYRPGQALPGAM